MWRSQIRMPLSIFIRKPLPQSISLQLLEENAQLQNLPTTFATLHGFSTNKRTTATRNPRFHFIWNSENLGKFSCFCSSQTSKEACCCWNCKIRGPFLFCESCGSIQPVDHSIDYFSIFGLERKFDIDGGCLEGTYKNWQKKLHPDLVHTKSEKEREYSAEQSARIIDAYSTLRKPLLRAIYIMRLEGIEVDEEQTVSDPELLGEIMEIREAVEEAMDSQALNQIQSQIEEKLSHWYESFASAFRSKKYDEALKSIQRMTYYHRVKEEIIKKL